jgi:hypothetical protein
VHGLNGQRGVAMPTLQGCLDEGIRLRINQSTLHVMDQIAAFRQIQAKLLEIPHRLF